MNAFLHFNQFVNNGNICMHVLNNCIYYINFELPPEKV